MDASSERARLAKIAAGQRGLFTRAQARECGYSEYQIRRRRLAGDWPVVLGSVHALSGLQMTPRVRDVAAHLALPGAVLGGPSAARWHGMEVRNAGTYVFVGRDHHVRLPDVALFREHLDPDDVWLLDDVYVTNPGRTVFDCLRVLPDNAATALVDRALQRGWTSLDELAARLRTFVGRRGAPRLTRLVGSAASGARSASERLAVTLLRRAGIWGWLANEPIEDRWGVIGIGDLVFVRARLLVELDGRAFHSDAQRFQQDRERQNRLVAAGWTVLRFTWHDLTERPDRVVATIRAMLDKLGVGGTGRPR